MTDAEFWEVERSLWLGGEEAFRAWLAAECVMVFPQPAGIMEGPAILEGIAAAPRWERVEMSQRRLRRSGETAVVLAYRGEAVRPDGPPYGALCSSTYVALAGTWRLAQHQQTPT
jgi:hypothetical protein